MKDGAVVGTDVTGEPLGRNVGAAVMKLSQKETNMLDGTNYFEGVSLKQSIYKMCMENVEQLLSQLFCSVHTICMDNN